MRLRAFVPILLAVSALAGCGSSNASSAAKDQAAAIKSAEAQAANQSTAPASGASASAPSSTSSAAQSCDDQTVNGHAITDIKLQNGATCADLMKVAASPEIGGGTFEWAVAGFHCAAGTSTMFVCDEDNSDAEVDFTATKQ